MGQRWAGEGRLTNNNFLEMNNEWRRIQWIYFAIFVLSLALSACGFDRDA